MAGLFGEDETGGASAGQPYRVLARKYRPSTFAELIGQEAMVRTLTHAMTIGRLPQAWMLTGVRGIGKTTTARIIAKALNCTGRDPATGSVEPCGVCESCRSIAEDRHVDVQEMDAASRTGVDDIREIIDGVRYGPVMAKIKIYILDEVHMLTKNAFNALLKTLEEPPPHTKFIFATTEIRKVPVTVLSRCQRFDLRRIDSEMLTDHFARIAEKEGAEADPEAIKLIAVAADGSVRDGLSLLDQAIARGQGSVTLAETKDMLGLADKGASLSLCRHLLRGEMVEALAGYDGMLQVGADPVQVLQDLAGLVNQLTRAQVLKDESYYQTLPEADRKLMEDLGDIKIPALARAWQILLKGIQETQAAFHPALAAEMVLIRLAYAAELPLPGDLIKQLRDQKKTEESIKVSSDPSRAPRGGGTSAVLTSTAFSGGPGGAVGAAARVVESVPLVVASAAPVSSMPQTFRELVALFGANREGGLYAELHALAHLVRMSPGKLEIRLDKGASPQLVGRAMQCLTQWTGQRWMVAVVEAEGEPTLAEQDRTRERERQARADAHPLMIKVRQLFPDAKRVSLTEKQVAPVQGVEDDALPADSGEENGDDAGER